jgi:hypothetical protein
MQRMQKPNRTLLRKKRLKKGHNPDRIMKNMLSHRYDNKEKLKFYIFFTFVLPDGDNISINDGKYGSSQPDAGLPGRQAKDSSVT